MKTLKESILNRSSHSGEGFKAQRREMIESWLKEYKIKNYTINDDFTIDVDGSVDLRDKKLKEFPDYIQFGVVTGLFSCYKNQLTSLRGAPKEVRGYFDCSFNKLTSLEGAPKEVGGFDCSFNKLTTLRGVPEKVGGDFYCNDNSIQFTEDDVRKVSIVKRKIYIN